MREFAKHLLALLFSGDFVIAIEGLRTILSQTFVACLLGIFFTLLIRPRWRSGILGGLAFLACQLVLIMLCDFGDLPAFAAMLAMLGGYAVSLSRRGTKPGIPILAALFFSAYCLYWLVEKYVMPLGGGAWIGQHVPGLGGLPVFSHVIAMAGISYIGFKFIHFHLDYRDGGITDFRAVEFLNWMMFFPSIVAGPMQRYQEWQPQFRTTHLTLEAVADGLRRLMTGLFLKFVLADTIYGVSLQQMTIGQLGSAPLWQLLCGAVAYSLYLYWDFAGYSQMAIGVGRMWGIRLPENFNWPYAARNLAEFWNRWHITLSHILRDYLYYPISLKLKRTSFARNHKDISAAIPPLLTFAIAGVWHGAGLGFLLYGVMQGIGLAYIAVRARYPGKGPWVKWWRTSNLGHILSAALNFSYVTASFVLFCLSTDALAALWHRFV